MGVVYRAVHRDTGQVAAVKTVRVPDARMLASIRREIYALSRVRHPNVVRILDEGVSGALPWYAMEYLDGVTLRDWIGAAWDDHDAVTVRGGAPSMVAASTTARYGQEDPSGARSVGAYRDAGASVPQAAGGRLGELVTLARRLCAPLAYLHGQGITHRDLKPTNIIVRPDGSPVVMDFGIVTRFHGVAGREVLEVGGEIVGTAAYMAPEQVNGELVDARADLYALGCMLYEGITGRVPFIDRNPLVVADMHLSLRPVRPSSMVDGVPLALEAIVLRLLAKDPRDRFGHADDVAAALAALGMGTGTGTGDLAEAYRPSAYLYRPGLSGRGGLVGTLCAQLRPVSDGRGVFVALGGESGVGKTRLAAEVASAATLQRYTVVACECLPIATEGGDEVRGAPLHPFRSLLQSVADRCHQEGEAATLRLLGPRARVLAAYAPALAAVPGYAALPEPPPLAAQAARRRVLDDLAAVVAAYAGGPVPVDGAREGMVLDLPAAQAP